MEGQVAQKRTQFQGPCYLKMLVNNFVAGAIIGKSGSVIASVEQQTGCSLKLSPSNAFYPGTQERVLIMGGQQDQLNNALICILEKIRDTTQQFGGSFDMGSSRVKGGSSSNSSSSPSSNEDANSIKIICKLAVPKSAVSAIIGKGGQQIRELQEQTQARVQVSSREEGLVERMITVTGNIEQVRNAVLTIASCIQNDPNLKDHMYVIYRNQNQHFINGPLGAQPNNLNGFAAPSGIGTPQLYNNHTTAAAGLGGNLYTAAAAAAAAQQNMLYATNPASAAAATLTNSNLDMLNQHCDIIIQVPDQSIGFVIGKNGSCVSEIIQATGARIQISQKGDLVPGTNDRRIVISGSVHAVHNAHMMLLQRIHSVSDNKKNNSNSNSGPSANAASAANGVNQPVESPQGVYVM